MVVHSVHQEDEGRRGDEHNVEHPEAVLGDGEGHVVTRLLTAWLKGVTRKLFLLVVKQVAGHGAQDQDTEDQHEEEPEAAQHGRVDLEGTEEVAEEAPFTHDDKAGPETEVSLLQIE